MNIFSIGNYNRGSVVNNTISLDNRSSKYGVEILQSRIKSLNFEDVKNEANNGNNTMWLDNRSNTYSAQALQSVTKTLNFEEDEQNEANNGNKKSLNVNFKLVNYFKSTLI